MSGSLSNELKDIELFCLLQKVKILRIYFNKYLSARKNDISRQISLPFRYKPTKWRCEERFLIIPHGHVRVTVIDPFISPLGVPTDDAIPIMVPSLEEGMTVGVF